MRPGEFDVTKCDALDAAKSPVAVANNEER